jgi:anti-sigma factor RsiW
MSCTQPRDLVGLYSDGELVGEERNAFEGHLHTCQVCAAGLEELKCLREKLSRIERPPVPATLADRVRTEIAREAMRLEAVTLTRSSALVPRRLAWAASAGVAFLLAAVIAWASMSRPSTPVRLEHDVLTAHLRSLVQDSPVQVASSESHVVKPWFAGRVDFAPAVKDLSAQGFPLIGGRLDYAGDKRVGTLVYKRRNHVVSVFAWAAPDDSSAVVAPPQALTHKGHNMLSWTRSGVVYWAVSDLNAKELAQLQELF